MPLFKKKILAKASSVGSLTGSPPPGSPKNLHNGSLHSATEEYSHSYYSRQNLSSPAEECYDPNRLMQTKSRLSKTMQEFLDDHGALAYFIQYMETEGEKHLVKFWLEIQSFRSAVLMRAKEVSEYVPKRTKSGKSVSFQIKDDLTRKNSVEMEASVTNGPVSVLNSVEKQNGEVNTRLRGTPDSDEGKVESGNSKFKSKPKTSSEEDALHIYQKYLATDSPCSVGIPEEIREQIYESITQRDRLLDPDCFNSAQQFVAKKMEANYFASFLRSSFHCKHQVDVLTSGQVFLADILYNDSTLFYFMEFMEQEGVRHLVDFLLMADNFRNHLLAQRENGYDSEQAQADAMVIYDKYFSLQATNSLGLSDRLRFEMEQNICSESGLQPDCFTKPVMILLQYIERAYLPQFLNSQLYFKYLSECIVTIQTTGLAQGHRKRSGSDSSSSEVSSLSQSAMTTNTLLAMESKQPNSSKKQLKHIEETDMRIDTGQFEPDSLWRRNLSGKLQMAHVDQYGKLISEFEPEPEKKMGSKLSKAVRKFVNWEDDKTQETMAQQVAEMIVRDVCKITLKEDSCFQGKL